MRISNKILLLLLLLLVQQVNAQSKDTDVDKIVEITINPSFIAGMKQAMLIMVKEEDKDALLKDFDAVTASLYKSIENFYTSHYTDSEIKELLQFYQTPVGSKFVKDQLRMSSNTFPKDNGIKKIIDALVDKYKL